jgi:hypothetical protein
MVNAGVERYRGIFMYRIIFRISRASSWNWIPATRSPAAREGGREIDQSGGRVIRRMSLSISRAVQAPCGGHDNHPRPALFVAVRVLPQHL